MNSRDSESSRNFRAKLKARGGMAFGLSLQPEAAEAVRAAMAATGWSRNRAVNEMVMIGARRGLFTTPIGDGNWGTGAAEELTINNLPNNPTGSET